MDRNEVLIRLSETGRFWQVDFEDLSRPEQVFRAIWELESEVNNGGFEQYYANSSGDTALAVVEALEAIGAREAARIVKAAHGVFPEGRPSPDATERQSALEELGPDSLARLEELDQEFFRYPDNLTALLYDYVREHAAQVAGAAAAGF